MVGAKVIAVLPVLNFAVRCWNTFLNKCGYVIHYFNALFFFANDITCCVFYIHFRLWKWCYTKSKFKRFSYSSAKWVIKQQKQLAASTHFVQKLQMNVLCSSGSISFTKEMRAFKMRGIVASHLNLTMVNWEKSWKLILLKLDKNLSKNSSLTICFIQDLKQIGKVEKLNKWADWK